MSNVPKLRFKEFSGDWESKKVASVFDRVSNKVDVIEDEYYEQIGIRSHGKGIFYKESVSGKELGNKRVFWVEPDVFVVNIVFAWEQAIAKTAQNEVGMIASHRFPMYRPKENILDLDYITQLFKTPKGKFLLGLASPGGAGRNKTLGQKEFDDLDIVLPSYDEQKKISTFISLIDKKIIKQGEKVEALKDYKTGMMQKIFSRELRFKGFSKEWKTTTLGKVTNSFEYGMNAAATEFDGENKYIRITDIDENTSKYINKNIVSPLGELEDKYLVKENDILFARTGASTGKTYIYDNKDGNLYFAGFLIKANVNRDNSSKFIFFQTKTKEYDKWVKIMSMRSGQPGINAKEYASYSFLAPSKEEQEKIGGFLMKIDEKIDNEMYKLESLNEYKKGLLQQMFV